MNSLSKKKPMGDQSIYGPIDRSADVIENEEILIGSLIISAANGQGREIDNAGNSLASSDFVGDPALGKLFAAIVDDYDRGEPIGDVGAIRSIVNREGLGGAITAARLGRMMKNRSFSPQYYVNQIKRNSTRARLRKLAEDLLATADDPSSDPSVSAKQAADSLDLLASRQSVEFRDAGQVAAEIVAGLDRPPRPAVFTGLEKFDTKIGGFTGGELIVVAARTSIGKSAFAGQIAERNGRHRRPVLFCSLEMDSCDIIGRIICREAAIGVKQLRSGGLNENHREEIEAAAAGLSGCMLFPQYMPGATVRDIQRVAKSFRARFGIGLLVIDYLQILGRSDARQSTREAIAEATRGLKRLAGELECPVLLLSQLNRESTRLEIPTLANLAESSAIEADADMVLAIHRKHIDDEEGSLLVLKNRNGPTGEIPKLRWNGVQYRFEFASDFGLD